MSAARVAQLVWYATGRFYKQPSGDLLDVGYFLHLQGIAGSLFSGKPSESTALFTFGANPFQTSKRLVSAEDFQFAGARYNFRELVGYGITQWGLAAAEPITPPPQYESVVPFVGSAIRIG